MYQNTDYNPDYVLKYGLCTKNVIFNQQVVLLCKNEKLECNLQTICRQFAGKDAICRQFAGKGAICRERCNLQEKVQFAGKGAICRQFAGNLQEKVQFADSLQAICRERCHAICRKKCYLQTVCKQFAGKRQFAGKGANCRQTRERCNLQKRFCHRTPI